MDNLNSWFGGPASTSTPTPTPSKRPNRYRSGSSSPRGRQPRSSSDRSVPSSNTFPSNLFSDPRGFSIPSIFSFSSTGKSGSSAYRRRPRDGFIQRMVAQIKRLVRQLVDYAKRNPVKLFVMVVMPLITGGALQSLLKSAGISLPPSVARFLGRPPGPGGYYGSQGYGNGASTGLGGFGLNEAMNIAKMFM